MATLLTTVIGKRNDIIHSLCGEPQLIVQCISNKNYVILVMQNIFTPSYTPLAFQLFGHLSSFLHSNWVTVEEHQTDYHKYYWWP